MSLCFSLYSMSLRFSKFAPVRVKSYQLLTVPGDLSNNYTCNFFPPKRKSFGVLIVSLSGVITNIMWIFDHWEEVPLIPSVCA